MAGKCQSRISGFSSLANFEDPLDLDSKVEGQGRDADRKPRVTAGFTEDFDQKLGSAVQNHRMLGKVRRCVHETADLDAADHSIKTSAASLPQMWEHVDRAHPCGLAAIVHPQVGPQLSLNEHAIERGQ